MPNVKLSDVAKAAGVSLATASRAVNGHSKVSFEVRKRVLETAEKLCYIHEGSIGGRKRISFLAPEFGEKNIYGVLINSYLFQRLLEENYYIELVPSEKLLSAQSLPFAVITTGNINNFVNAWGIRYGIPMIAINAQPHPQDNVYTINSNHEQGIELAVKYLRKNGHTRIGMLFNGGGRSFVGHLREETFWKYQTSVGYKAFVEYCTLEKNEFQCLGQLLQEQITALIVPGESLAQKIIYALSLFNIKVPENLSVLGFEVPYFCEVSCPPMTTVGQDFSKITQKTVDILKALERKEAVGRQCCIDHSLFERKTVNCIK